MCLENSLNTKHGQKETVDCVAIFECEISKSVISF